MEILGKNVQLFYKMIARSLDCNSWLDALATESHCNVSQGLNCWFVKRFGIHVPAASYFCLKAAEILAAQKT
jgi:hypothetical protein